MLQKAQDLSLAPVVSSYSAAWRISPAIASARAASKMASPSSMIASDAVSGTMMRTAFPCIPQASRISPRFIACAITDLVSAASGVAVS